HAPNGRRPAIREIADLPAVTPESIALSKALKKRGFKFVGPTTAYAHMQAVGVVNDHVAGCLDAESTST
ncbi:MAG: DNA-3-methyladenine glycosylase I, partial [Microbacteriaceae bacterium]|nr:DNA-3-methyladenine glycosylase I [Microbacteriaceae bacterium]